MRANQTLILESKNCNDAFDREQVMMKHIREYVGAVLHSEVPHTEPEADIIFLSRPVFTKVRNSIQEGIIR